MKSSNKKYIAIGMGIVLVSLIWSISFSSIFNVLNGFFYDSMMRHGYDTKVSDRLILVEAEQSYIDQGDEVWRRLLENLLTRDVKQIVFNFFPDNVSADFYRLAAESGKVVFGRGIGGSVTGELQLAKDIPVAAQGLSIDYGWVLLPKSQQGIYRTQYAYATLNNAQVSGIERVAADHLYGPGSYPSGAQFLVNFSGGPDRIPIIDMDRVLSGNLVTNLVKGITIFIAGKPSDQTNDYYTPIATDDELTTATMFHAFALDTLLSQRQIKKLPQWAGVLATSGITAMGLFFFQWLSFQASFVLSILITLFYGLLCWLTLNSVYVWLPLVEIFAAIWLTYAIVWRFRIVQEKQEMDRMLMDISYKIQEKTFPVSFYLTDDPWTQLIRMVNQTLNLNRTIFLERVAGDHRLREIKSLNCTIDDILELRRDYLRYPYTTAIHENAPLLLERPYLKELEIEDQQYLAPLIFAGDVLGFWAFSIEPDKNKNNAKFKALTRDYMVQISEILHYRQELQKTRAIETNKVMRYLKIESDVGSVRLMRQSLTLLDRRISELQEVFNSLNTCSILYDLFGRVLLVNRNMELLAQESNLKPFNVTMLDFLVEITGYDIAHAKIILQQVIFDHSFKVIPLTEFSEVRDYLLYIRPLEISQAGDEQHGIPAEINLFETWGILLELVDFTEVKRRFSIKEKMLEHFGYQMRNDLNTVSMALSVLKKNDISEQDKAFAFESVESKIEEIFSNLESVKTLSEIDTDELGVNPRVSYPIDGRTILVDLIDDWTGLGQARQLELHCKLPDVMSLVYAAPNEYEVVLNAIFEAVLEDTYNAGEIWIEMIAKQDEVCIRFRNKGIGILESMLSHALEDETAISEAMANLLQGIKYVNHWHGNIQIRSVAGQNSVVELTLRKFM